MKYMVTVGGVSFGTWSGDSMSKINEAEYFAREAAERYSSDNPEKDVVLWVAKEVCVTPKVARPMWRKA